MTRARSDTRRQAPPVDSGALHDDDLRALARFRAELRAFLRQAERNAEDAGLTPGQYELLLAVRGWPQPHAPAVGELAEHLAHRPHSTLELVRRAEQHGLVVLNPDPLDARRQLVTLSPRGRRAVERAAARNRDELRELARALATLS